MKLISKSNEIKSLEIEIEKIKFITIKESINLKELKKSIRKTFLSQRYKNENNK
jgi:hypothetical protein